MKSFDLGSIYQFNFPTVIQFGIGVRQRLGEYLKTQHRRRPLIVTDRGLRQTAIPGDIQNSLKTAGQNAAIFSEIFGNPVKSQVSAGVQAYRDHNADCIVALGGGAAVDVAKAIALMIHHPGDLFDYEDGKPDALPIDKSIPLLVALPTTSGTGSEVGRSTVISDDHSKIKKIIFSPRLLPAVVFADAELTKDLPPAITAATGMDALTHLVEAYLAKGFQPLCDGIALEGLKLVRENLEKAVQHGGDLEARSLMLAASMMGAVAFQKGLGVTHSCAHALSTVCDVHHGLANGVLIPYAMKFNRDSCMMKFETMAGIVNAPKKTADGFIDWLVALKHAVGIPAHLKDLGVQKQHLPRLVEIAVRDVCHSLNPKAVSKRDFEGIFQEALGD